VFTVWYALSPYIKQTCFIFKESTDLPENKITLFSNFHMTPHIYISNGPGKSLHSGVQKMSSKI